MLAAKSTQAVRHRRATNMHDSLSLVSGSMTSSLWHKTLGQVIDEQALQYQDRLAASFPWQGVALSYRELHEQSLTVAKALLSCELQHGDRVAIMAGNCFQYLTTFLGSARIGCPFVVLNNTYTPTELVQALSTSSCSMLFLAYSIGPKSLSKHFDCIMSHASNVPDLKHIITLSHKPVQGTTQSQVWTYQQFLEKASTTNATTLQRAVSRIQPSDVLNLQFTSGTTGSPKAAMLTHNNLVNNGRLVGAQMELTPKDVVACPPPLFHCFGLVMGFLASFTHGSKIVFPCDQFQAEMVLDSVHKEKCTAVLGVPTMFFAMLEANQRKKFAITTVRTGLAAGSSVPVVLMRQLKAELGIAGMLIAYGMTETSPVTFITSLGDSEERRTKTVGQVMPHTGGKVVDRKGNIVPRGTPGELCTSGYALQKGYWKNEAKTNEVMQRDADGVLWMHTGDECVIDGAGYCMVTGRIKDIIIRGGENIFPLEIEERLLQHHAISEAIVVAIKDVKYGEVVGAFLKRVPGAVLDPDEVVQWTRQALGSHKSPTYCFFVGDLGVGNDVPKTGSGKYQKHIMRAIGDRLVAEGHPAVRLRHKL